jgi:hypothetical protein
LLRLAHIPEPMRISGVKVLSGNRHLPASPFLSESREKRPASGIFISRTWER